MQAIQFEYVGMCVHSSVIHSEQCKYSKEVQACPSALLQVKMVDTMLQVDVPQQ